MSIELRIFDTDKNGFISLEELNTIVNHLFHLVPESHRQKENTPEKVKKKTIEISFLLSYNICQISARLMSEMDSDNDGVISEDEFVLAFLRNETLTSNLVNKIMTRFTSARASILED